MNGVASAVGKPRISRRHLCALRKIYRLLHRSKINWVVCAGMGLALHGVPVEVHDIDLQTDAAGAYQIERLFAKYVTRRVTFSSTGTIRSHFGALCIEGITVEIIGDMQKRTEGGSWEPAPDLRQYKQFVAVEGMRIPVVCLEYECEAYRKLGRPEKAKLVREWLEQARFLGSSN